MDIFEKIQDKQLPDRPLECGECKKHIAIHYTEIVGDSFVHTGMCADCPELQLRLHGTHPKDVIAAQTGTSAGLTCGNCGTTLEEVRRGHSLGCPECYTVFEDVLIVELQSANRLSSRSLSAKKNTPIHIGRSPGEKLTISPSSQLLALNEALTDTLNREDYEQAAWLRDQIKALTENKSLIEQVTEKAEDKKDGSTGQN